MGNKNQFPIRKTTRTKRTVRYEENENGELVKVQDSTYFQEIIVTSEAVNSSHYPNIQHLQQ